MWDSTSMNIIISIIIIVVIYTCTISTDIEGLCTWLSAVKVSRQWVEGRAM